MNLKEKKNVERREKIFWGGGLDTPYIYRHHRVFCFNKTKEKTEREKQSGSTGVPRPAGGNWHSRWVIKFER